MTGLVFDIDDTLYCRQDMLVKAAETVLGTTVTDPLYFIKIFYDKSDINMRDLESGKITTREINGWRYEETFKALALPFRSGDGVLSADAYLELQSHMCLSEDMIEALDSFASNPDIKLAVLTAGESEHQRHKIDMLGLDRWFNSEDIIVSGETGFSKPDVRLCRIVEEKLGLKPDELWMIGDSYKHDITGAIDSGWHTIWINRRSLPHPDRLPDFEVTSDKELTSLLRSKFT
ncbi:MAG: HAD family hydrolase [Clostridiales bacterium]|nr:HAD family hydrolase [Clostridiales bacterium]